MLTLMLCLPAVLPQVPATPAARAVREREDVTLQPPSGAASSSAGATRQSAAGGPVVDPGAGGTIGLAFCPTGIRDYNLGNCIYASAVPTLGQLFPLSTSLNVDAATSYVGMGTTAPEARLHLKELPDVSMKLEADLHKKASISLVESTLGGGRIQYDGSGNNRFWIGSVDSTGVETRNITMYKAQPWVGIGTTNPFVALHVKNTPMGMSSPTGFYNETLAIEGEDAVAGLYSADKGNYGSGLVLAEVAGGFLTDKWSIVRNSTSGGSDLVFSYGTDVGYHLNPVLMKLRDTGELSVGGGSSTLEISSSRIDKLAGDLTIDGANNLDLHSWGKTTIDSEDALDVTAEYDLTLSSNRDVTLDAVDTLRLIGDDVYILPTNELRVAGSLLYADVNTNRVGIFTLTPAATLDVAGSLRCVTLTQTSDARFKRDVRELEDAMELVRGLRGVSFEWDPERMAAIDPEATKGRQVGFLAQEVREVLPEVVHADAEGSLAVAYTQIVPVLVEALQEQDLRMDALERELEELRRLVAAR